MVSAASLVLCPPGDEYVDPPVRLSRRPRTSSPPKLFVARGTVGRGDTTPRVAAPRQCFPLPVQLHGTSQGCNVSRRGGREWALRLTAPRLAKTMFMTLWTATPFPAPLILGGGTSCSTAHTTRTRTSVRPADPRFPNLFSFSLCA